LIALILSGISACAPTPYLETPRRIVQDAHGGGGALAISADSRYGASGGWSGILRIWQLPAGNPLARWSGHQASITGLAFLADPRRLLSTGRDGRLKLWDISGRPIASWDLGAPVTSFQASADRALVLLGLADGRVELWTVSGEQLQTWRPSGTRIAAVAMNASANRFAAADSGARVWRWSRRTAPAPLASPASSMRTLAFDPRDDTLWGGGWFDLYLWSVDTPRFRRLATPHRGIINHIEFGPQAAYLATISRQTDSAVLLLDPDTGESVRAFQKHALCGVGLAISPDGRRMMSNADDASVRFYDLSKDE
jgi:WD40 repeat protein